MTGPRRSTKPPGAVHRLGVFVPAIMSVGMAFWLLTLVRDLVRWRGQEAESRRATAAGRRVAAQVGSPDEGDPVSLGLRPRGSYVVVAVVSLVFAVYVLVGSVANYLRPGGYVNHQGWLLALALIVAGVACVVAAGALHTWHGWPPRWRWVRRLVARTPLSTSPPDAAVAGRRPGWQVSAALLIAPAAGLVVTFLVVTEWRFVGWVDRRSGQLLDFVELEKLSFLDPVGSTAVGVSLAAIIGISTLRCRPLAVAYPVVVVMGLAISHFGKSIVERPRPPHGPSVGGLDSFPSGHLIQATLIAGLLPLALAVLFNRRGVIWPARLVLGLGVVGAAMYRIDEGIHWTTDVIASLWFGAALVLFVEWAIEHEAWHVWCRDCPWTSESLPHRRIGAIPFRVSWTGVVSGVAHLWATGAVILLTYLSFTDGIPIDPDGALLGPSVQQPVQLALAAVASVGALAAWRWPAGGAVMLAVAGSGLGIFAALEYVPMLSILLAGLFITPAVLLWLTWQHERSIVEIVSLAVTTAGLLIGTWVGASEVHDRVFGPTHPESSAAVVPMQDVEWLWMGALTDSGVDVVVDTDTAGSEVRLVAWSVDSGEEFEGPPTTADERGQARVELRGLRADTEYGFVVEVDGVVDDQRGRSGFRTAPTGPESFRFVFGGCARTGSNGAVFDAMADEDPLFFLALGDMHYGNIEAVDPSPFRDAYRRLLTEAGPAALYRTTPVAYVWDDHDYGPNDSDASSPGRSSARLVYRDTVPHYPLAETGDAPIHQSFTIGRVRFVLTDTRSERTGASMLGDAQRDWLLSELVAGSRTHAAVIWANSVPWVSESKDGWGGWPGERQTIADALVEAGVENLIMVSGDAHMIALDDGSNTDFSTSGTGGFPLFHSAALDRPGNIKGGPYSDGAFPGGGQYGLVEVHDDGSDSITVTFTGRSWDDRDIVTGSFDIAVASPVSP
jgi:hypothetical protein